MSTAQLILASASPRRRELLEQIGLHYVVQVADIDESPLPHETATALVKRLALEKAQAVWNLSDKRLPVLGADTLGLLADELLVKPKDFADAQRMLRQMSNQWHDIYTAVALVDQHRQQVLLNHSRVKLRNITDDEILAYWQSGEPQDKAGAYAIQGRAAIFVERLEGSYSAVMGLPLFETAQLLQAAGIHPLHNN